MTALQRTGTSAHPDWATALRDPYFRIQLFLCLLFAGALPFIFNHFFEYIEARDGKILSDPLLALIPGHDVSWTIFFFLYSGVAIGIYCNARHPLLLLTSMQTYLMVTYLRIGTLSVIALDPPPGYIPLNEPFVQLFTDGGKIISKDLFFSGHVSTIASIWLSVQHRQWRPILMVFTVMVGIGVLVQHNHYVIDVAVAPLATWLCYRISISFRKKFLKVAVGL